MRRLVALEMMVAAQALDLGAPSRVAPAVAALHGRIRSVVPRLDEDRPTGRDVEALARKLHDGLICGD